VKRANPNIANLGEPLHCVDITKQVMRQGLVESAEATNIIKRLLKNNTDRFAEVKEGYPQKCSNLSSSFVLLQVGEEMYQLV